MNGLPFLVIGYILLLGRLFYLDFIKGKFIGVEPEEFSALQEFMKEIEEKDEQLNEMNQFCIYLQTEINELNKDKKFLKEYKELSYENQILISSEVIQKKYTLFKQQLDKAKEANESARDA